MSTQPLEAAIATTRSVLAGIGPDQLDAPSPCAQWKVRDVVNHIVGGQKFFTTAMRDEQPSGDEVDYASGDFVASFDDESRQCIEAFQADGALQKTVSLPFGDMPGAAVMGLAMTDTFTHAWDVAKATGQDTDLAPELAAQLLEASKMMIQPAFRSEEGTVFGPEQPAPEGASTADQLAAFLGRKV
jgi:uncharacterized protein (TIGR03086 family)